MTSWLPTASARRRAWAPMLPTCTCKPDGATRPFMTAIRRSSHPRHLSGACGQKAHSSGVRLAVPRHETSSAPGWSGREWWGRKGESSGHGCISTATKAGAPEAVEQSEGCYRCREPGHVAHHCPAAAPRSPAPQPALHWRGATAGRLSPLNTFPPAWTADWAEPMGFRLTATWRAPSAEPWCILGPPSSQSILERYPGLKNQDRRDGMPQSSSSSPPQGSMPRWEERSCCKWQVTGQAVHHPFWLASI